MPLQEFLSDFRNDTSLRVQVMYFPDRIAERYKLTKDEIAAVKTGDFSRVQIDGADAEWLRKTLNYDGL